MTKQLDACTKGSGKSLVKQLNSDERVKPRSFSWKPNYVNKIFYSEGAEVQESSVMDFIIQKIQPFKGMSINNIYQQLNIDIPKSKNQKHKILNKIMGVTSYSEILNIKQSIFKIKNIELKKNGKLKEEIGLMNVNSSEFIDYVPFDESELYTFLISYKLYDKKEWVTPF